MSRRHGDLIRETQSGWRPGPHLGDELPVQERRVLEVRDDDGRILQVARLHRGQEVEAPERLDDVGRS